MCYSLVIAERDIGSDAAALNSFSHGAEHNFGICPSLGLGYHQWEEKLTALTLPRAPSGWGQRGRPWGDL